MHRIRGYLVPLWLLLAVVLAASRLAAGDLALPIVSLQAFAILGFVLLLYLLHFLVGAVLISMIRARHFQNPATRQLNIRGLWASMAVNPVSSSLAVVGLFVGVTACGNLVEVYRAQSGVWHDSTLWNLEQNLFVELLASPLNVPAFWDAVYFAVWSGLFLGSSALFVTGYRRSFFLLVTALVWSFVLTRVTAIYFPTQGPVFFMPDMFSLSGTISAETQNALARYMAGEIRQNGLLPGTMAMPSLHVAMPFLVTVLLARELPRTLWLTVPWFVLNWASTVFLGWHYAVDGLGGVLIALIALGLAFVQQWAWDSAFGLEPVSRPRAISPDVTNTQAARASARATRSWLRRASRLSMSRSRRARGAVRAERRG